MCAALSRKKRRHNFDIHMQIKRRAEISPRVFFILSNQPHNKISARLESQANVRNQAPPRNPFQRQ